VRSSIGYDPVSRWLAQVSYVHAGLGDIVFGICQAWRCLRIRLGRVFYGAFAAMLFLGFPSQAQHPTTTILMTDVQRTDTNVTVRWQGGFPPFRVRFKSDLNASWIEHPQPLATNEFTTTVRSDTLFFDVRTEFEPLKITAINYVADANYLFLTWQGGTPPYRIQSFNLATETWEELPEIRRDHNYVGPSFGSARLFRVTTVADSTPPSPPASLTLFSARCDRVLFSWSPGDDGEAGSGILSYTLYRNQEFLGRFDTNSTIFLDQGLVPGTCYEYQIAAMDLLGNESIRSIPLCVTTPECSTTETNLEAISTSLSLSWDRNEETCVAGYIIHWGTEPGSYSCQMDVMESCQATLTDLVPGSAYFISVTAYSVDGVESEPAPELIFIPPSKTEISIVGNAARHPPAP
jgi:Fibronectin type III domain